MFFDATDLVVHYGKVEVVKRISLSVQEGECVCVIGSNGAGKTTIMKAISGLKTLTSGSIFFLGERVDGIGAPKMVSKGISLVPEGRWIFQDMSVIDNLLMGAYLRNDKSELNRMLDTIFKQFPILLKRKRQMGGSLSGGEQQMLTIGRALMSMPRLLLLDEPTLGLAPLIVKQLSSIIKEINQTGISVILVEQNSKMALRISTKGYLLEIGKITMEDDAAEILKNAYVIEAYLGGS
jgi:branched-chain amino acid transport system ATP-binding protein